ncbi:MAG: protein kinase, partial [Verrucomicrobiaceae bacterium]|nr:protein kinase [Verrucomicrobiaceae bacterium]
MPDDQSMTPDGESARPLEAGAESLHEILPNYEVLDFIGRGGMGAVYKARQKSLNRIVAVKLLSAHSTSSGLDFAARFKVEAQAMARLSHPNIVPVHDFGETEDGHLFYVMELVDGCDLAKRIESEGRLPPDEAVRILLAVCDALACAHEQGVVHRDIKPSNILLSASGQVKVADFGLAKIDDPATASLTLSGTSMGSQGYAAPEVFSKAGTADHRADIYSLGVLLYEMLTGAVPRGMFKLPSEKVPGLDPRFDAIICKAMEEEREERQQSVAEMKADLEALQGSQALVWMPETRIVPVKRPQVYGRWFWSAATAAALVAAGFFWRQEHAKPAVVPETNTKEVAGPELPAAAEFRGHRYQYIPGAFTWNEAEANAASLGGHLVTLTSAEENHWLWTQFSSFLPAQGKRALSERGWWIGGKELESGSGQWTWVTGEAFEYTCWSVVKAPPARVPRLRQHHNGGGGSGLSAWSPVHYSYRCGYVVEWDAEGKTHGPAIDNTAVTDEELRRLATWLFSLPDSTEPGHPEHTVPDLLLEGATRNLSRVSELPEGPLQIARVRVGPLRLDEAARAHLAILARTRSLYDLRIYAAEDAAVLGSVHDLTRLGTLVFKAAPASPPHVLGDDDLRHLARLDKLTSLRIEGWSGFSGRGLAHLREKKRLAGLSVTDCADLSEAGIVEIARFVSLDRLGLAGAVKIGDWAIQHL